MPLKTTAGLKDISMTDSNGTMESVGKKIADSLALQGVDTIFCVPGESYLGLTDALTDVPAIRLIVCRHEGGAGSMAIADGLLRGRAGVCLVSRGPGLAHALVALHTAFHDAVPLVILIGQVERHDMGRMALQEQNYSKLLCDITKAVIEVNGAAQASDAISRAFHLAQSGTPGPVAVVLPEDLLDEQTDAALVQPRIQVQAGPRAEDLAQLATLLAQAKRPLIWVGATLTGAGALADLEQLAEQWNVPVCSTNKRPHLFDSSHSHFAGHVGIRTPAKLLDVLKQTDLLIALGERLTDTLSQYYTFPAAPNPQMPLVHVWPDANEVGRVWRPALGLACEPHAVVRALLQLPAPAASATPAERQPWVDNLHALQQQLRAPVWDKTADGVNFAAVVCAVNQHLAADAVITLDAGSFSTFVFRYIAFHRGQQVLTSVVGAMGAGVPMAVAAALRNPQRQVVAFVGDGGALMTGNELATARLYGVNPIIIIADNGYYGTIGLHQDMRYPGRPFEAATQLANPDFALWAQSFGAVGITIANEAEIDGALAQAFAPSTRPVVVHVKTSAMQMSAWRQASRKLNFSARE